MLLHGNFFAVAGIIWSYILNVVIDVGFFETQIRLLK